jgi:beta-glucanase (GH16 family)
MKLIFILMPLLILLTCLTPPNMHIPVQGYEIVWRDEFDGNSLDRTKWMYRANGKRGDAWNVPQTISLDGKGCLVMKVAARNDTVYAGMISTDGLFSTRYGYFECRAQLTRLPGLWPAFWLQSPTNTDNSIPERDGAEIDIFEYFPHIRTDAVTHTLHYGGYGATHKKAGPVWGLLQPATTGFHTFGLAWEPEGYTTFVDGVKTYQGNILISHVPEYLVLSMEVNRLVAGPLNKAALPDSLKVDYVRVYKK